MKSAGATQVLATDVPPKGSLKERSQDLAKQILDQFGNEAVHVIAHSMGGLDARFLIANGGANISSLTTLGTPFRGTLAADVAVDPARLLNVSPTAILSAITRYETQLAIDWPFDIAAETHFVMAQLRIAVGGLTIGDYSHLLGYFRGLFTLGDPALSE